MVEDQMDGHHRGDHIIFSKALDVVPMNTFNVLDSILVWIGIDLFGRFERIQCHPHPTIADGMEPYAQSLPIGFDHRISVNFVRIICLPPWFRAYPHRAPACKPYGSMSRRQ